MISPPLGCEIVNRIDDALGFPLANEPCVGNELSIIDKLDGTGLALTVSRLLRVCLFHQRPSC